MTGDLLDVERPPVRPEDVFSLLSHSVRRRAVEYLYATPKAEVSIGELARALDDGSSPDLEQELRAGLCNQHLPQLERAGLVEYQPDEGIVQPTDRLGDPEPVIRAAEEFASDVVGSR